MLSPSCEEFEKPLARTELTLKINRQFENRVRIILLLHFYGVEIKSKLKWQIGSRRQTKSRSCTTLKTSLCPSQLRHGLIRCHLECWVISSEFSSRPQPKYNSGPLYFFQRPSIITRLLWTRAKASLVLTSFELPTCHGPAWTERRPWNQFLLEKSSSLRIGTSTSALR